jgi:hypothetical protein
MTKIDYTQEQIWNLSKNIYVEKVTSKNIIFTTEFKYLVLKSYDERLSIIEIFKKYWFPDFVINSKTPKRCLDR